jgi:hypothetical protein
LQQLQRRPWKSFRDVGSIYETFITMFGCYTRGMKDFLALKIVTAIDDKLWTPSYEALARYIAVH